MKKIRIELILAVATTIFALQSCNKDNEPISKKKENPYVLTTAVKNAGKNTLNYYLQSLEKINDDKTYDNSKATEVVTNNLGGVFQYDGYIFFNAYGTKKQISKWIANDKDIFENKGTINTSELGFAGNVCLKDKNTAFVGGNASSKILIFDPSTMQKTGAIDISSKTKVGTVTNYPESGDKVNVMAATEMIIRGNYLFVGFMLLVDAKSFVPSSLTADIMVIDLSKVSPTSTDNANAFVKWISDDRGVSVGAYNAGIGASFMVKDENDDIYVLCHNMWGNHRSTTNKAACILRIKNGATDFDSDYYFDLETASRGLGSSVTNFEYAANGDFFAASIDLTAIDPKNPYSHYLDPIYQWYKFNLKNKTAKRVNDKYTKAALVSRILFEDGKAYIPYENKTESYILEVDINTLKSKRVISVFGSPILFKLK